ACLAGRPHVLEARLVGQAALDLRTVALLFTRITRSVLATVFGGAVVGGHGIAEGRPDALDQRIEPVAIRVADLEHAICGAAVLALCAGGAHAAWRATQAGVGDARITQLRRGAVFRDIERRLALVARHEARHVAAHLARHADRRPTLD